MPFKPFFGVPSVRYQSALSETVLSVTLQKQGADIISLTVCPFGVFGRIFWLFCHLFWLRCLFWWVGFWLIWVYLLTCFCCLFCFCYLLTFDWLALIFWMAWCWMIAWWPMVWWQMVCRRIFVAWWIWWQRCPKMYLCLSCLFLNCLRLSRLHLSRCFALGQVCHLMAHHRCAQWQCLAVRLWV